MLTLETARELLSYNPDTGEIIREISYSNRVKAGSRAGTARDYCRAVLVDGEYHKEHRIAWLLYYGEWPNNEIDHIDGDPQNNRINNLRDVTHTQNHQNRRMPSHNKSGVMGVWWDKARKRWCPEIKVDKKKIYLGRFEDWFEAVCARKAAEYKYNFHPNHGRITEC